MTGKGRLGQWIADNPIIIMAAALLLTVASLHYTQQIEMQGMTTEGMVGKDSALYQLYDHLYVEKFATESIAVLIEADDVTKPDILRSMDKFSQKMRMAPDVLAVTSIADIVADTEMSESGIRKIPTQERVDEILAYPSNLPAANAMMPDKKHTMLSIDLPVSLTESQLREIYAETSGQVKMAEFPPDVIITVTGEPALMQSITDEMAESNGPILALAGILMIVALLISFNHVRWSLLPIPIVFLGVTWSFGAMGFLHIPFTMVSMSAFPVLIGIGIDYAIQFHNRIDEEFVKSGSPRQAVIETVSNVSKPVMIALIITAMGFISLLTSSVPMTRDFGLLCLIGLFLCYLSALFVGVTLLYLMKRRNSSQRSDEMADSLSNVQKDTAIGSIIEKVSDTCIQRWHLVLAVALFLSLVGIYADTQVQVETDFKNYVPQDLPPLIDFRHMSDIFGGTDTLDLIVQADDITDPNTLHWIDDFSSYLKESRDQIYGYESIASLVKQYNQGVIPEDTTEIRAVIDELPAGVLSRHLDGHDTALIKLSVGQALTNLGAEGTDRLIKEIDKDIAWNPPPPGVSVRETGDAVVMTTVISALTQGRTEMTLLGLVLIFIVLLLIYRDLIKALLPVLPMLVVIGWMGGVMYQADMKYSPLTACLGSLILGVGSEYAILMMERFYEELSRIGEPLEALRVSSKRIGSALIASGLTTIFGFAALISSPFLITNNFGTVTVLAIIFALLTTFTVFVVLMYRMEIQRAVVENAKYELQKALKLIARGG
ncbi:MAG: bifunctional preprotein translocase subunit SecD/SecF [Methanosaeta sp. PtaU1.Bin112]|nr:MAG: bifunctional preprotein translocase subunit SecD/SecF [Methanosaeta sp. PtaU1.Bin112]